MTSQPLDLSITGIPSPRIEHPRSGSGKRTQTPLSANRSRSLRSDVFSTTPSPIHGRRTGRNNKDEVNNSNKNNASRKKEGGAADVKDEKRCNPSVKFQKNEVSAPSVITKSALENIKQLTDEKTLPEEAEQLEIHETSRKPAPQGVPQLSLDDITGADDVTYTQLADSDDDESERWMVPEPATQQTTKCGDKRQTKGGGWQVSQSRPAATKTPKSKRPDDVPELDLMLSQSNGALGKLKETVKKVEEDLQIEYMGKLKDDKEIENLKRLSREKKNELFEEAILAEQLANIQVNQPTTTNSPYNANQRFDSRVKRHNDLYSSSTVTVGQNGSIDKRLQFAARILTLNGHDARREINGFFIVADQTIAMYEFRQFGTRSKALPFIQRGSYCHLIGHRKGERFHLLDIAAGKDVTLECAQQASVPAGLKQHRQYITFRITEVDEEVKKTLLFDHCKNDKQRKEVHDFINFYYTRENNPQTEFLKQIQSTMQASLEVSREKILTNFFHELQKLDVSATGLLRKELYWQQLNTFRLPLQEEVWERFWSVVDEDGGGVVDYGHFMRTMFGEMNEERKLFVRKAFSRLDPNKRGVGEVIDIRKYFLPSKHPSVVKGDVSEFQLLDDMVKCFKCSKLKKEVSFSEFEVYYEGVSMGIKSDQSFINLLRITWNI